MPPKPEHEGASVAKKSCTISQVTWHMELL